MSILLFDIQSSPNLLSNPGFETAGAGDPDFWANWTEVVSDGALANETVLIHEGSDAAKLTAGATKDTSIFQTITVVAGKKYRLRFWTRGDGTYAGTYTLYDNTNSAYILTPTTTGVAGATYTAVVYEFTAPAGCTSVSIYVGCPTTAGGIAYFDACEVRALV